MKKLLLSFIAACFGLFTTQAQVMVNWLGMPYFQNFNQMPAGPSNTVHTMPITSWHIWEKGVNANNTIRINAGDDNSGDTYNYGTLGASDRALGALSSASNSVSFGCHFENASGKSISGIDVRYNVELWRSGDTIIGNADTFLFEYSLNANNLNDTTATWINVTALNLIKPDTILNTIGPVDGDLQANKRYIGRFLFVNLLHGNTIWFRWRDSNIADGNDGLAIDDLIVNFGTDNIAKPHISSFFPADGASNVPVSTDTISIVFNQQVIIGSVGVCRVVNVTDGAVQTINSSQITDFGNQVFIKGVFLLPNKAYSVLFDSTLVISLMGPATHYSYGIYDNTTWNFNTNLTTPVNDVQAALQNMHVVANSNDVSIRIDTKSSKLANIDIIGVNGQVLMQTKQSLHAGENTIEIPIASLPNGLYFVRCTIDENRVAKRFLKQ